MRDNYYQDEEEVKTTIKNKEAKVAPLRMAEEVKLNDPLQE